LIKNFAKNRKKFINSTPKIIKANYSHLVIKKKKLEVMTINCNL